jgi:hypothetical protein
VPERAVADPEVSVVYGERNGYEKRAGRRQYRFPVVVAEKEVLYLAEQKQNTSQKPDCGDRFFCFSPDPFTFPYTNVSKLLKIRPF